MELVQTEQSLAVGLAGSSASPRTRVRVWGQHGALQQESGVASEDQGDNPAAGLSVAGLRNVWNSCYLDQKGLLAPQSG